MNHGDGVGAASQKLIVALHDSLVAFVSQSRKPDEIFQDLLDELIEATASEFGFISELVETESGNQSIRNLALSNISWDESSRSVYQKEFMDRIQPWTDGNLTAAVRVGAKALIINQFPADAPQSNVPKGHQKINCFLGLPIFEGETIVGIMGVANRAGGYDETALPDLAPLATTCAAMIASLRQEDRKAL
jgi:GAF domain-containing protein